jgi:hypothetical protein
MADRGVSATTPFASFASGANGATGVCSADFHFVAVNTTRSGRFFARIWDMNDASRAWVASNASIRFSMRTLS